MINISFFFGNIAGERSLKIKEGLRNKGIYSYLSGPAPFYCAPSTGTGG
jgi:hypothetical protein